MPSTSRSRTTPAPMTRSPWPAKLEAALSSVGVLHLDQKGRGRALRAAWSQSDAAIVAYMDVDLSTDLTALLPLVAPLISGHSDLAIGSRLSRGSRVIRGTKREVISRCYNLLLRSTLAARFSDAQCGFKAIRKDVAMRLLPLVEDTGWFFDTELLVIAEKAGLRIHEVPVDWIDDPDSRVDIMATAAADLRGVARVGRALATGSLPVGELRHQLGRAPLEPVVPDVPVGLVSQVVRFAAIGVASTLAYLALFLVFRSDVGRARRERVRPSPDCHREYGGKPAAHLSASWPDRRRAGAGAGPGGVRVGRGPDQRRTGHAVRALAASGSDRGGRGACPGEPCGHRPAIRVVPGLGVPPNRHEPNSAPYTGAYREGFAD